MSCALPFDSTRNTHSSQTTPRTDVGQDVVVNLNAPAAFGRFLTAIQWTVDAPEVEAAVRQNGVALRFALGAAAASADVVRLALRSHGRALEFAGAALQADREVRAAAAQAPPEDSESGACTCFDANPYALTE